MTPFPADDRLELLDLLEDNGLFIQALWSVSKLYFTDTIATAAVCFKDDGLEMLFNLEFWTSLPDKAKMFVVCHEQLHIMSNHYERLRFKEGDQDNKNKAADVCINESLIRNYFFEKEDMPEWEQYCWLETVFPDQQIPDNETAEYYYSRIRQRIDKQLPVGGKPIDEHVAPESSESKSSPSNTIKDAIKNGRKQLSKQLKKKAKANGCPNASTPADLNEVLDKDPMHGTGSQTHSFVAKPKTSWKSIYKNIAKTVALPKKEQSWITQNRNHSLISDSVFLPGDYETEINGKAKILVYLDTSGSCVTHAEYFLRSALSLPSNLFETTLHGFCEHVYELPSKPPYELKGFGVECYQAVEDHVESQTNVQAVMVFTDGISKQVMHNNPSIWHWFITPHGTILNLDPRVKHYDLANLSGWKIKLIRDDVSSTIVDTEYGD